MKSKLNAMSLACAAAMLMAMGSAHAAESAGFGVTGTITPNACDITLGGGGLANYGTLLKTAVQALPVVTGTNPAYNLGDATIPITVNCNGVATKAELAFVDNKSAQRLAIDATDARRFGVSDGTGTTAIGAYGVRFANFPTLDGTAAAGLLFTPNGSTSGSATWTATNITGTTNHLVPGYTTGFVKSVSNTTPDSFTVLSGNLTTALNVSKAYVDASANGIQITGSGTVTVVYL